MSIDLRLTYDAKTDVAYLSLRTTGPTDVYGPTLLLEPDREFPGRVAMDFTVDDGCVVGFEFMMASLCLPAELLLRADRVDGRHLAIISEKRIAPVFRRLHEGRNATERSASRRRH